MKKKGQVKDLILWTFLAIVLGMIVSMAFLPLLGVNPIEATKIMFTEVFSDKFTMGNILVKTTPLILTSLAFAFTFLPLLGVNPIEATKIMFTEVFSDKFTMGNILVKTTPLILTSLAFAFTYKALLGVNPIEATKIMFTEVFSDKFTMGNILVKTTPLILTSLAFAFTYKANLYNIGAQGQFYVGCICATATSLAFMTKLPGPLVMLMAFAAAVLGGGLTGLLIGLGQFYVGCICATATSLAFMTKLPGPLVMLMAFAAAVLGGGLTGLLIGFLKAKFNANEFLVSMMSTYVIQYLLQYLLRTVLQEPKREYLKTQYLDASVWLPKIIPGTSVSLGIVIAQYLLQYLLRTVLQEPKREYLKTQYLDASVWLPKIIPGTSVSLGIVIAVLAAVFIWFVLYRTSLGYRIRVTGLNQDAAAMSGIKPGRMCMTAFFISGAIAGLAGFTEINGMQHMLLTGFESDIGSYGIGIAIMRYAAYASYWF